MTLLSLIVLMLDHFSEDYGIPISIEMIEQLI